MSGVTNVITLMKYTIIILMNMTGTGQPVDPCPGGLQQIHKRPATVDVGVDTCWLLYLPANLAERCYSDRKNHDTYNRSTTPPCACCEPTYVSKRPHDHRKTTELIARPWICGLNDRKIHQQSSEQDKTRRIPSIRRRTRHYLSTAVGRAQRRTQRTATEERD